MSYENNVLASSSLIISSMMLHYSSNCSSMSYLQLLLNTFFICQRKAVKTAFREAKMDAGIIFTCGLWPRSINGCINSEHYIEVHMKKGSGIVRIKKGAQ